MHREPVVIDCWFDSGSMPFAQWHYPFENKEEFERRFPADYISEAVDQTRGWFYTLSALSTILFDKPAFNQDHRPPHAERRQIRLPIALRGRQHPAAGMYRRRIVNST